MKINESRSTVIEGPAQRSREHWEYRTEMMPRNADLSQFGTEGWHLVAVIAEPGDMAVFYFKRAR